MTSAEENLSQFGISVEEKDKLIADVIRYVLFKTHQSSDCPIKREELTQLITKNYSQRSLPAFIINEAATKLSNVFGYELKELQRVRSSSTNQSHASQHGAADAKSYVLISQLPEDVYRKHVEDVNDSHLSGFAFVVISIVHLAGGKIPEENLLNLLKRVGLSEKDEKHPVLGNTKQAVELLVQQRYLQKDKTTGPEGNILFYELAERALDGSVNSKYKEFIAQIVQKESTVVDVD